VAVRPAYFDDFYSLIGQTPGSFYALVREDGAFLARYPVRANRTLRLSNSSALRRSIVEGRNRGEFTVSSEIDGTPRRIAFRKLAGYPVYALAGTDSAAIRHEVADHYGGSSDLRAARHAVAVAVLWVALRRTRAALRRGRSPRNGGRPHCIRPSSCRRSGN